MANVDNVDRAKNYKDAGIIKKIGKYIAHGKRKPLLYQRVFDLTLTTFSHNNFPSPADAVFGNF